MTVGIWQVVLILAVVAVLFGGKRLGRLGGELGRGLRGIRKGLSGAAEETDGAQQGWVKSAVEVGKTAQHVRKATRLGRRFPFG